MSPGVLEMENFNRDEYEIVSYDCVQLFTSINIDRVLKFILDKIYSEPLKFFPETTKLVKINKELINRPVEPPPRHTLLKFFKSVLCDFNSFEAHPPQSSCIPMFHGLKCPWYKSPKVLKL